MSYEMACVAVKSDNIDSTFCNRRYLSTYTSQYAKSAGSAVYEIPAGVRSHISLHHAEFGYGGIQLDMIYKTGDVTKLTDKPFSRMYISARNMSPPAIQKLSASEYQAWAQKHELHFQDAPADEEYDEVYKLNILVPQDDVRYSEERQVLRRLARDSILGHEQAIKQAKQTIQYASSKQVLFEFIFPAYTTIPQRMAQAFANTIAAAKDDPYTTLYQKVPWARVFRTKEQMPSIADCDFTEPDAPLDFFDSQVERAMRLGIAVRDEFMYLDGINALCERRPNKTVAFTLPNHKIRGVDTGHIFALPSPQHVELLPNVLESCIIRVDCPFEAPTPPAVERSTEDKIAIIYRHLWNRMNIARDRSGRDETLEASYIFLELDAITKPGAQVQQREAFITAHAQDLVAKRHIPDANKSEGTKPESTTDHRDRVRIWVDTMFRKGLLRLPPELTTCPDMTAVRIPSPAWLSSYGWICFYVRNPIAPGFKNVYPPPRVDIKHSRVPIESTMTETMSNLKRKIKNFVFRSTIIRRTHDGLLKANLEAIAKACKDVDEQSNHPFDLFMRFGAKLKGPIVQHDLTEAFPALQKFLSALSDENEPVENDCVRRMLTYFQRFDPDQRSVFTSCKDLDFGTILLSGCPGSGKNDVTCTLTALLSSGGVNWEQVNRWYETTDFEDAPMSQTTSDQVAPTSDTVVTLIVGAANAQLDKMAADTDMKCRELGLEKKVVRIITRTTAKADMSRLTNPRDEPLFDDAREFEKGVLEAQMTLEKLRVDLQGTFTTRETPGGEYAVTRWAHQRLTNATPGDELVTEIRDLEALQRDDPETFYATNYKEYIKLTTQLIKDEYESADFLLGTPEAVHQLACQNLAITPSVIWIDEVFRMTEPDTLIALTAFPQVAARILTGDIAQCRPIVKSMNASLGRDVDTAFCAQFGEQLHTAMAARWYRGGFKVIELNTNWRSRGGLSVFSSNEHYDGNMNEAHSPYEVPDAQARIIDLFTKLSDAKHSGGPILAINIPGGSETKIGTSITNPAFANAVCAMILLIFRNDMYEVAPTAESPGKRASIRVVCFYKEQALLIKRKLAELSPAEIVHKLVDVATIQESQGAEATIVLKDYSRDKDTPGYIGKAELNNVADTRAKLGLIVFQNNEMWDDGKIHRRDNRIRIPAKLDQWCKDRGSFLTFQRGAWDEECDRCHQGGHGSGRKPCNADLRCPICSGRHHIRSCPRTNDPQYALSDEIPINYTFPAVSGFTDSKKHHRTQHAVATRLTIREQRGLKDKEFDGTAHNISREEQKRLEAQLNRLCLLGNYFFSTRRFNLIVTHRP
ncbi:P-loop containing nucleoside triphosphate hydrolase protein [Xylariales sp. AK1849]|nr:P-loop containing nucleoside triphosphate hydrolase protein [Xylariales sp. AK1849]